MGRHKKIITLDPIELDEANRQLTQKQSDFCIFYAKSLSPKQAAIDAGYSPATSAVIASKMLTLPKIRDEIKRHIESDKERIKKTLDIDKTFVLVNAAQILENCLKVEDNANALKALELIGKHIDVSAFLDKKEAQANTTNNVINAILPSYDFRKFIEKTGIINNDFINSDEKVLELSSGRIIDNSVDGVTDGNYIDLDEL